MFMKKNPLRTVCLALIGFIILRGFSSCEAETKMFEGSVHELHRVYGGNSYPNSSPDEDDIGFNIGFLLLEAVSGSETVYSPSLYKTGEGTTLYTRANSFRINQNFIYSSYSPDNDYMENEAAKSSFKRNIYLLTGFQFVLKNSKDGGKKIGSGYLEVPVYATYLHLLKNSGTVFGGVGPYVAYGIMGKVKSNGGSIKTFDKNNGFKRFDAGISITAGYKLPMELSFRLAYDLGLADIDRIKADYTKNRSFGLNISYPIRKILKK